MEEYGKYMDDNKIDDNETILSYLVSSSPKGTIVKRLENEDESMLSAALLYPDGSYINMVDIKVGNPDGSFGFYFKFKNLSTENYVKYPYTIYLDKKLENYNYSFYKNNNAVVKEDSFVCKNINVQRAEYLDKLFLEKDITPYAIEKALDLDENRLNNMRLASRTAPIESFFVIALFFEMKIAEMTKLFSYSNHQLVNDIPCNIFKKYIENSIYKVGKFANKVRNEVREFNANQKYDFMKYKLGPFYYYKNKYEKEYNDISYSEYIRENKKYIK